jgi:hypothetical protein
MTEQSLPENENTKRIRAFVRTFMSPAIWMFAGYQAVVLLLMRLNLFGMNQEAGGLFGPLLFTALFLGLFFLAGGLYQSFASSQSMIQIPTALANGRQVFTNFILLSVKAGLLGFLAINVLIVVAQFLTGMETEELIKVYARYLTLIVAILGFIFVYWLPLVFVRGNFRLLDTLGEAFRIGRARLAQSGFLAALILLPPMTLMLLPEGTPSPLVIGISVVGELFAWVAFVYCADYLQSAPPPPAAAQT